jgi:hypothetical protein
MQTDLRKLVAKLGIRITSKFIGEKTQDNWLSREWKVTLRLKGRQLTTAYFTGMGINEPDAASVIYSLCSDARVIEYSFEEFCSEFGYDSDSRKAERTYNACVKMAPKVRKFLGEHFEACSSAEH